MLEVPAAKGKPAAQIVFVDTPGVHKPGTQLDRRMMQEVYDALETRDVVILLVDASREMQLEAVEPVETAETQVSDSRPGAPAVLSDSSAKVSSARGNWRSEDEFVLGLVRKLDCPVFLVINKIDLVRREELLPLIDSMMKQFPCDSAPVTRKLTRSPGPKYVGAVPAGTYLT